MSSATMDIMSNKMKRDRWLSYFGRLIIVFAALAFAFFPIIWIASASLNETGTLNTQQLIPAKAGLKNFCEPFPPSCRTATTASWSNSMLKPAPNVGAAQSVARSIKLLAMHAMCPATARTCY